jgi:asparaginyl-tRNA synthetase
MDFEIRNGTSKDVMTLLEDLLIEVIVRINTERKGELQQLGRRINVPSKPFKVYTSHEMEEKYGKDWEHSASLDHKDPFWVTCFKREFYDREDTENPGHYVNYDLIYPQGFEEAVSGAEREWKYERLMSRMRKDGLNPEDYKDYLEVARRGLLSPSAGAGIGVERLVRYLVGAKHVGDIQPFRRVPGETTLL